MVEVSSIDIRPCSEADAREVRGLFGVVYQKPLTPEWWRWRYAGGRTRVMGAWDGSRLVGAYSMSRVVMFGTSASALLSLHTMTHPDYRRMGLFTRLAEAAYQRASADGYAFVYGFPNDQSYPGFMRHLKWVDLGDVIELRGRPSGWSGGELWDVEGGEVDPAWGESDRVQAWRDRDYLEWRYRACPVSDFWILGGVGLSGVVVIKLYGPACHVCDLLAPRESWGELLGGAWTWGMRNGAEYLSAWALEGTALRSVLDRAGFRPTGFATHLGVRSLAREAPGRNDLHVTMGDSDVF